MKQIILAALILFPLSALADHIDVIEAEFLEGCSQEKYLAIVADFNEQWGKKNGYQAEILFPIQSNNMTSIYWVGRSANAAAFGAAYDKWINDLSDPDSVASGLMARFNACTKTIGRRGYMAR